MKSFIVNFKDLADKKKNPHFSLSPRDILKNKKIPKHNLCSLGGDSRHCEECAYSPDYKFNPDTGECEVN